MDADEGAPGFKVLLLGDSGVGKTSLTQLICHRKPELDPPYTVGCQVQIRSTHCTHAHSRQALNCHAPCPCRFTLCSLVVVPSCTLTTPRSTLPSCPHAIMSTAPPPSSRVLRCLVPTTVHTGCFSCQTSLVSTALSFGTLLAPLGTPRHGTSTSMRE